jgi:hypothetical protein
MSSKTIFLVMMAMALTLARPSAGAEVCAAAGAAEASASSLKGTVVETMNASRYTYAQIDTGKGKVWVAGPKMAVKVGDSVSVSAGMPNKNFYSPTLKRKFDELYFVGAITPAGGGECPADAGMPAMQPNHPSIKKDAAATATNAVIEVIEKPGGGKTVAEVWAEKATLSGKQVVVRAKVVKVVANVLGMTWLHLRDGSGSEGSNDLTVTTKSDVKVGQIVTASGPISIDKDFGAGYRYEVIMEGATVTLP